MEDKLPEDVCPECRIKMVIAHRHTKSVLYKCRKCGYMVEVKL